MPRIDPENIPFSMNETSNSEETIKKARRILPDMILLDMKILIMDGYQAAVILKKDPGLMNKPIIAVSASALKEEEEKITNLCDAYLQKTVIKKEIVKQLMRFLPHIVLFNKEITVEEQNPEKTEIKKALKKMWKYSTQNFEYN